MLNKCLIAASVALLLYVSVDCEAFGLESTGLGSSREDDDGEAFSDEASKAVCRCLNGDCEVRVEDGRAVCSCHPGYGPLINGSEPPTECRRCSCDEGVTKCFFKWKSGLIYNWEPVCICPEGKSGNCMNPCNSSPCQNGGKCSFDYSGNVYCDCEGPYLGRFCDEFPTYIDPDFERSRQESSSFIYPVSSSWVEPEFSSRIHHSITPEFSSQIYRSIRPEISSRIYPSLRPGFSSRIYPSVKPKFSSRIYPSIRPEFSSPFYPRSISIRPDRSYSMPYSVWPTPTIVSESTRIHTWPLSEPVTSPLPNPCRRNPCLNGGQCFFNQGSGDWLCRCQEPYFGQVCQKSPCTENPCLNNGQCAIDAKDKEAKCECAYPYFGKFCEKVAFWEHYEPGLFFIIQFAVVVMSFMAVLCLGICLFRKRQLPTKSSQSYE